MIYLAMLGMAVAWQPSGGADALVAGARCEAEVRARLTEWNAELDRALPDPPGPAGERSARVPTGTLGLWLRIVNEAPGEVALERVTSTRIERLRFDLECAVAEFAVATSVPPPEAFGDSDLIERVARDQRGVILLWSPHMPLSVDQHGVLARAAGELGLSVVAVVDPAADAGYASRVARERGLPASALRTLGGVELVMRGMTTHTPSLQVFAGGRLIGPILYGYRNATALREALQSVLGSQ